MFSVDSTGPVASGLPPATSKVTNEALELAFVAINELCDTHGKCKMQPVEQPHGRSSSASGPRGAALCVSRPRAAFRAP